MAQITPKTDDSSEKQYNGLEVGTDTNQYPLHIKTSLQEKFKQKEILEMVVGPNTTPQNRLVR